MSRATSGGIGIAIWQLPIKNVTAVAASERAHCGGRKQVVRMIGADFAKKTSR
jgi:hypothetical protein